MYIATRNTGQRYSWLGYYEADSAETAQGVGINWKCLNGMLGYVRVGYNTLNINSVTHSLGTKLPVVLSRNKTKTKNLSPTPAGSSQIDGDDIEA